ncbi:TonB-dependent receptor plug domain-containing protein [Flavobacterium sp. Fl-77]|uniref:TonB-dependent receptor plug domain-containing protein n=1 Tax=Flavobacterium flavipigmentatum TaxID=2893884 RepID=A0AAJ2S7J9_9FLAO|nr:MULTISPECIES: carboxypeptidase-like regulatory domain-containing protein [unclassified Flavobacterium]MDX6182788.1 TonB-dependent receptor plug domain-containing protein [Flavobacterium sp. Fl-33]MDX6186033.1 TonB-dependent receptor plug domain-containing protein [Flavobacterium sp. Fl-77]UFH38186.1 TonB-dependent receptor [Flavobacterium sp. F-70]
MLSPKSFHFLFGLFFFVLNLSAQDKGKAVPFKKIIIDIEQKHHVNFNYTEENIADLQLVPPKKSLSLEQKLQYLAIKTHLSFENIGNQFINIYKKEHETHIICGYVFSGTDKKPIENANISLSAKIQVTTDSKGYFEFKKENDGLLFISHVGFTAKRIITVNSKPENCLQILLEPEITQLEEIKANAVLASGISKNSDGSFEIKPKKFGILPGLIEPDALQTMQQIPGVNSLDESVSSINVRGGTHDQNLFLWNGIRMFQTGHFFGLISVFNPNLANSISIYKNGSSAFYGESVSSVVAISSTLETAEKNSFSAGINMINADVYAKYNLSKKSYIEISARKSITDFVETPTYKEYFDKIFQNTTITDFSQNQNIDYQSDKKFGFYDATLKYAQKIGLKDELVLDLITIKDNLEVFQSAKVYDINRSENNVLRQQNYGGNLSWKRNWNRSNISKINVYNSSYELLGNQKTSIENQIVIQENTINNNGFNLENNHTVTSKFSFNDGYQFNEIGITNLEQVTNPAFYRKVKDVLRVHALILEGKYNDTLSKIYFKSGTRINYIEKFKKYSVEPRIQFGYGISKNLNLELLGELKSQNTQQIIDLQKDYFGIEKRRWIVANNTTIPIQRSKQISLNLFYKKNDWLLDIENFYKKVSGITTSSQGFQNQLEFVRTIGNYEVWGAEMLIQKKMNHYLTWLSYTYNHNNYHFANFEYPIFPNNFQLMHTISWAGIYEKNNFKIAIGTKWSSGRPKTSLNFSQIDSSNPVLVYNKPNNTNLNVFSQINFSSTYNWKTANGVQYKFGISILNILNRKNEISEYYRMSSLTNSIEEVETFALQRTPNVSIRVSL